MFSNFDIKCKECGSKNVEITVPESFDGDVIIKAVCHSCKTIEEKQCEIIKK